MWLLQNLFVCLFVCFPISQNLDLEICRQYFVLKYSEKATLIGTLFLLIGKISCFVLDWWHCWHVLFRTELYSYLLSLCLCVWIQDQL